MPKKKPHPLTKVRYYATVTAAVLAILSFFALLFLVPFVYDPSISTLSAGFPERPATCLLSQVRLGRRLSQCSWTSCSEGCTAPMTRCVQLRVNVSQVPFHLFNRSPGFYTDQIWVRTGVPFKINIQACGYPPTVNCSTFLASIAKYGPGANGARPAQLLLDDRVRPASDRSTYPASRSETMRLELLKSSSSSLVYNASDTHSSASSAHSPPAALSREPLEKLIQGPTQRPHINVSFERSVLRMFRVSWPDDDLVWDGMRPVVVNMRPGEPTLLPCYPASAEPDLVIMDYSHARTLFMLVLSSIVPALVLVLSVTLLCYCHAGCCKRNCPQLPIPEESDRMTILPPDLVISRASDMEAQ